jgi:hypothetical protein
MYRHLRVSAIRLSNGAMLAIGGKPVEGPWLAAGGYKMLVLAAKQHQPPDLRFPGVRVVHCPLPDKITGLSPVEHRAVVRCSKLAARYLADGKSVMFTCEVGLNRSALIATMALRRLGMSRDRAIRIVRKMRLGALNNPRFVRIVKTEPLSRVA